MGVACTAVPLGSTSTPIDCARAEMLRPRRPSLAFVLSAELQPTPQMLAARIVSGRMRDAEMGIRPGYHGDGPTRRRSERPWAHAVAFDRSLSRRPDSS